MGVLRNVFNCFDTSKQHISLDSPELKNTFTDKKNDHLSTNSYSTFSDNTPLYLLRNWISKSNNSKNTKHKKSVLKKSLLILLLLLFSLFFSVTKVFSLYQNKEIKLSERPYVSNKDYPFSQGCNNIEEYLSQPTYKKQNATFVMLTRNQELDDVIKTLENIEIRFNQWFQYPYVFLNDVPFEESFQIEILKTVSVPKSMVKFGVLDIVKEWTFNDENSAEGNMKIDVFLKDQEDRGLLYGGMKSYHKMCRFYSGFFQDHELLKPFDYYWRIEPDVKFFCDLTYDPFYEMNKAGKKYGFTILISELYWTIPSLFRYTKTFINNHIQNNPNFKLGTLWDLFIKDFKVLSVDDNEKELTNAKVLDKFINNEEELNNELSRYVEMKHFLSKNKELAANEKFKDAYKQGALETIRFAKKLPKIYDDKFFNEEFNLCHFWSNFEIASFEIFRSPMYREYFEFLDEKMGFTKERFGDAPVHTLGVAMLLNLEDVHYFRDIAYSHSSLTHCIKNDPVTGDFQNKVDSSFLADKWVNYKHYPYTKTTQHKKKIIANFRKLLTTEKNGNNGVDIGCNCDCPINHNEIENSSKKCSTKLFDMMKDDYTPKEQMNPELVLNLILNGYTGYLNSL